MTITRAEVDAEDRRIAAILGVDNVVNFSQRGDGAVFAEMGDGVVHLKVRERADMWDIGTYDDLDAFMYEVTEQATRSIGCSWEMEHRAEFPEDYDTRIGSHAKQLQLLTRINPVWGQRFRASIAASDLGLSLEDIDAHPVEEHRKRRHTGPVRRLFNRQ
ncbi:Imm63 family immunity protein [Streptomyces violascens]|uniref:Imm63 family immunity protein n=1 Tax=Streptomyces violascens TaxID=67381 RepID=UPI003649D5D8